MAVLGVVGLLEDGLGGLEAQVLVLVAEGVVDDGCGFVGHGEHLGLGYLQGLFTEALECRAEAVIFEPPVEGGPVDACVLGLIGE